MSGVRELSLKSAASRTTPVTAIMSTLGQFSFVYTSNIAHQTQGRRQTCGAVNHHAPLPRSTLLRGHLRSASLPLMATKPFKFSALRAAFTHSAHTLIVDFSYSFRRVACAFLETIFPRLFLISWSLVRPEAVFSLLPRRTCARCLLPLATLLTRFAFITFIAFIAELFMTEASH